MSYAWQLKHLTDTDLSWPDRGNPKHVVPVGTYGRSVEVYPAPMYRHLEGLVEDVLDACTLRFPIHSSVPKVICTMDREFISGFNGLAFEDWDYRSPTNEYKTISGKTIQKYSIALGIAISGKQVPQHPAWTRYLISHEYGHCAWYASKYFRGYDSEDNAEAHYMAMRGLPEWKDGARWHQRAIEVIANDFRIIVAGQEPEHWPHEVTHPKDCSQDLFEWWSASARLCAEGIIP